MQFGTKKASISRRVCAREPVMLAGSAMSVTRSRSVVVADLSRRGAQLGGRDLPLPGDDVLMVIGSSDRMGTVMWRSGDKCGIRFDQALADENIGLMKQEASWAAVTGWAR